MNDSMTIGVIAENRYLSQTQPSGMISALKAKGQDVHVIDPGAKARLFGDNDWLDGFDIMVARGRSWGLLTLLALAEAKGIPTLNTNASISAVHNKAEMSVALAAAGLPTPTTYFGTIEALADTIDRDLYPVILKPIFGDNCRGLVVVESADDLASQDWPDPVALAQNYIPTDGFDLKLYGIGDQVWAVRKRSPFNKPVDGAEADAGLQPITSHMVDIGRRCGALFGLELFGIDCIVTPSGPLVIEVNDYPNYTDVPDADDRLADFVIERARKGRSL